mgnify:CR=1 FL=1
MRTNLIAAAVALAVALLPSAALAEKTRLTAVSGPVSGAGTSASASSPKRSPMQPQL